MAFNELIDSLFKVENDMSWFVIESITITYVRWNVVVNEKEIVRGIKCPMKREI